MSLDIEKFDDYVFVTFKEVKKKGVCFLHNTLEELIADILNEFPSVRYVGTHYTESVLSTREDVLECLEDYKDFKGSVRFNIARPSKKGDYLNLLTGSVRFPRYPNSPLVSGWIERVLNDGGVIIPTKPAMDLDSKDVEVLRTFLSFSKYMGSFDPQTQRFIFENNVSYLRSKVESSELDWDNVTKLFNKPEAWS